MKTRKEEHILSACNRLFLQHGYEHTTMRQISEEADVSLGLATYHFKTKRQLAVKICETYLFYLRNLVDEEVSPREEPLLHSATMVRICIEFFSQPKLRRFYLECLANDIYADSIQRLGNRAMNGIAKKFAIDLSSDLQLLYDNYIPPNVEKILMLEKERNHFTNISYEDVPDIVFAVSVERNLNKPEIDAAAATARIITTKILRSIPDSLTEKLFAPQP